MIDASSGIAFGLLGIVVGSGLGILGFLANVKSKAKHEGVVEGTIQTTVKNIETKIDNFVLSNQSWQEKHSEDHKAIDKRLKEVEDFKLVQENKPIRRPKSDKA